MAPRHSVIHDHQKGATKIENKLTSVAYLTTSGQVTYSFPMDYLKKSFITATLDGKPLLYGKDYTIVDKQKQLELATAPQDGLELVITRETTTDRLVSFQDASILKTSELNINQVQQLHILEEINERVIVVTETLVAEIDQKADDAYAYAKEAKDFSQEANERSKEALGAAHDAHDRATEAEEAAKLAQLAAEASATAGAEPYDPDKTYNPPDRVTAEGQTYQAAETVQGEYPPTSNKWALVAYVNYQTFEQDGNGDIMPTLVPKPSAFWQIDPEGDIMPNLQI